VRYTNSHSTALCSPTRAAIITGRNHHSVSFGVVSEQATGYPGYDSFITKDSATIGEILKENGYRPSWFGKDHNTPDFQASQAGPFDQWPTGMGFDYFYGFVGGDSSQWQPNLFRNTIAIYPYVGQPSWNLITGMADDAIQWMNRINDLNPDQPFLVYYVPGATHAPHRRRRADRCGTRRSRRVRTSTSRPHGLSISIVSIVGGPCTLRKTAALISISRHRRRACVPDAVQRAGERGGLQHPRKKVSVDSLRNPIVTVESLQASPIGCTLLSRMMGRRPAGERHEWG
jgi:hypothetical protein